MLTAHKKGISCEECGRSFTLKCHLACHQKSHSKKKSRDKNSNVEAATDTRSREFETASAAKIREREREIVDGVWPKKCFKCNSFCNFMEAMEIHMTDHWLAGGQCPVCDHSFGRRSTFEKHLKTHMMQEKVVKGQVAAEKPSPQVPIVVDGHRYMKISGSTFK